MLDFHTLLDCPALDNLNHGRILDQADQVLQRLGHERFDDILPNHVSSLLRG
jgi:hypothetical protein